MSLTVGILIGGSSRRMGSDKALIPVGGVTLLERTAAMAATVTEKIVLLGKPPFALPRLVAGLRIVEDIHAGLGPIGGLEALLSARPDDDCLMLACDMPRLSSVLLRRLRDTAAAHPQADAVVCATPDLGRAADGLESAAPAAGNPALRLHPCCAIYRKGVLPRIAEAMALKRYAMMPLIAALAVEHVVVEGDEVGWLGNLNTPGDIAQFAGLDDVASPAAGAARQDCTTPPA